MPTQIIIGRRGNQPFPLHDPKVSGKHAVLTIHEGGQIELTDTNSTNGTYIYDGRAFKRLMPNKVYRVTGDSMIQLGPDTRFHVRRLLPAVGISQSPQPPQPPKQRVDISHLRRISDRYNETKMALETKASSINGLRSLTLVASLVAGTGGYVISEMFGFGEKDVIERGIISIMLAVMIIVILLGIINNKSKTIVRDRNENEKQYAIKYCCPKCQMSFKGRVYENILSEGRCPRCKTEYYEVPGRH